YRGLESLLAEGKVGAIGVSNFMTEHLERLLAETDVVTAVSQMEIHPYFRQSGVQQTKREYEIVSQSTSQIGGIIFFAGCGDTREHTLHKPTIGCIVLQYGTITAQVMLL